jgi:hypothetical protein
MSLNRKVLTVSICIIAILISLFVLVWGNSIYNKELALTIFLIIEIVLVFVLGVDAIKNK